jgi:hypothetical protein
MAGASGFMRRTWRPSRVAVQLIDQVAPPGQHRSLVDRALVGDLPGLVVAGPHKDHVDLRVATRAILERAGVAPDHIDDRPPCTRCEPERFFSYRRDGRAGGIHMSFIGLV